MTWPCKNDTARLYRERNGSYLMVFPEPRETDGCYDAIANMMHGDQPCLGTSSVHPAYLQGCKRVEWAELPDIWKRAFNKWFDLDKQYPETIRGLWRIDK